MAITRRKQQQLDFLACKMLDLKKTHKRKIYAASHLHGVSKVLN